MADEGLHVEFTAADEVELYDVRTIFVMEEMKHTTALPLHHVTLT